MSLDIFSICNYNVNTMDAKIIPIGNSKGIRLPKALIKQAGIYEVVHLEIKDNGIMITPVDITNTSALTKASEASLSKLWDDPREDEAWQNL